MKNVLLFILSGILGAIFIIWFLQPWTKVTHSPVTPTPTSNQPSLPPSHFSLENAPSQSLRGEILSMTGNVSWQSRTATESSKLDKPIPIQQGEMIETGETGHIQIQFSETDAIDILPESKLEFAQTLPTSLVLNQSQGSTEYKIAGPNQVSVRSLHLLVKLTPGNFTITTDKESLKITIKSLKGTSQVAFNDTDAKTQVVNILERQQLIYDDELRTIKVREF